MPKTKVAIIGTVGIPAKYGGFETLAEHLTNNLKDELCLVVYCTKKKYGPDQRPASYNGAQLVYLPFDANGIQSIIYDCVSILHALFYADVLLILGVSGGIMLPLVRWFTRKKIIISIDGIEWKRGKWRKLAKWYLWAAEWMAVRYSHADIADNESIQDYTAIRYKTLSTIIEYGADHATPVSPTAADQEQYPFLADPYVCSVCRIEPENNIHIVLDTFRQLPGHTLVIVGNWNNSSYGQDLREQHRAYPNLRLLDAIYDQQTLDLIRSNCTVYIHGHCAGGTNPSLVDAMYLGLPIIAFNVTYNRTTTEGKALYFRSAADLIQLVLTTSSTDLAQLGTVMQAIAQRRYKWALIAKKYGYVIRRVLKISHKSKLMPTASHRLSTDKLLQHELGHLQSPSLFYEQN